MEKCPWFWNKLKLEKQIDFEAIGVDLVPYNERFQIDKTDLFVQHSPPSYSENAPMTSLKMKMDQDHIWGCAHRTGMAVLTGSSGKTYTSYIGGWFGDRGVIKKRQMEMPENRRVFFFTKNHQRWNCSFHLVTTHKKIHHVQQIIIKKSGKDYTASVGQHIYVG